MKKKDLIAILIALVVFSISSAFAIPCAFEGYASIDGNPVPDGTLVAAYVNGVLKSSFNTITWNGQGYYGLQVDAVNETVTFKVAGYCVNEAPQICYSGNLMNLNLTVTTNKCGNCVCESGETCSNCPVDCGTCPPPTPYCGDGSCNGAETCSSCPQDCGTCPPPPPPPPPPPCQENWTCTSWSDWSDCINNVQTRTRTCNDLNNCNTTKNKPNETETRPCIPPCEEGKIRCDSICVTPLCTSDLDCVDNNACTLDVCNYPNTCIASCSNIPITTCANGDGCCPVNCNSLSDNDCLAVCGNGICENGESCDSCAEDCGTCAPGTTGLVITPASEEVAPTGFFVGALQPANLGALVLFLVVVYAIYLIFYKKKKEE
ncbi:MAG: hypothetical protein OH319_05095 [Candidatus Parvarchaeota archaeon]|nr:hypothetical protein [Candidatus Jingweiarchaeum tengchongense]MCW1297712.1 hypothetical protein [Candidatus Jingweiarchaeum tengchongense]MCW1299723.1 hypothetical protein [Candidatus Jingweiarchaeum tengchongense]MCW1304309.1 hypothetical protein [Candidatus Jingweiarchaeum tengchongense]MCW1305708.1 hypothetical protein [Candidatus Jingweiarchaeum tengchongense]